MRQHTCIYMYIHADIIHVERQCKSQESHFWNWRVIWLPQVGLELTALCIPDRCFNQLSYSVAYVYAEAASLSSKYKSMQAFHPHLTGEFKLSKYSLVCNIIVQCHIYSIATIPPLVLLVTECGDPNCDVVTWCE